MTAHLSAKGQIEASMAHDLPLAIVDVMARAMMEAFTVLTDLGWDTMGDPARDTWRTRARIQLRHAAAAGVFAAHGDDGK